MNADFFDTSSHTCPICQRSGTVKPHKFIKGLLTCHHCRQRLVVSRSGHYVRDPFALKSLNKELWLRQQSHPLARIWRDFTYATQPLLLATLGSAFVLGVALSFCQGTPAGKESPTIPLVPTRLER